MADEVFSSSRVPKSTDVPTLTPTLTPTIAPTVSERRRVAYTGDRSVICCEVLFTGKEPVEVDAATAELILTNPSFQLVK